MEIIDKEVDFHRYWASCKHRDKKEKEEPCSECLEEPFNANTSKPVKWEDKK